MQPYFLLFYRELESKHWFWAAVKNFYPLLGRLEVRFLTQENLCHRDIVKQVLIEHKKLKSHGLSRVQLILHSWSCNWLDVGIHRIILTTYRLGKSYQQLEAMTFIKDSFLLAFELPFLKKKCILFIFVVLSVSWTTTVQWN